MVVKSYIQLQTRFCQNLHKALLVCGVDSKLLLKCSSLLFFKLLGFPVTAAFRKEEPLRYLVYHKPLPSKSPFNIRASFSVEISILPIYESNCQKHESIFENPRTCNKVQSLPLQQQRLKKIQTWVYSTQQLSCLPVFLSGWLSAQRDSPDGAYSTLTSSAASASC